MAHEAQNGTSAFQRELAELREHARFGILFSKGQFAGAELTSEGLKGLLAQDCDFSNANFNNADLRDAGFIMSTLTGANFTAAQIDKINFVRCNLKGAQFAGLSFRSAQFVECDLSEANFEGCRFSTVYSLPAAFKQPVPAVRPFKNLHFQKRMSRASICAAQLSIMCPSSNPISARRSLMACAPTAL